MDSSHSHLNSAEGSKCLNFILSIFSVLERNTVKCPRGSFTENAMRNVNELGWGHTFFHIEPVQKQIRDSRSDDLQGSAGLWHGVILYFCSPSKDWQKDHGGFNPKCPHVPPSRSVPGLRE